MYTTHPLIVLSFVLYKCFNVNSINSIDKSRLSADSFSYTGSGVAWKARVILFVGFAFMAGGLAGSVTVLVLKYLIHGYNRGATLGYGVSNVVANALVMLRYFLPSVFMTSYIIRMRYLALYRCAMLGFANTA
jgi:Uncharacterised protein family (UPF0220)